MLAGASSLAEEFHFVGHESKPYVYLDEHNKAVGTLVTKILRACESLKWNCDFTVAPHQRALALVISGKATAIFPLHKSNDHLKNLLFSEPIAHSSYVFMGKPDIISKISQGKIMKPVRVGVFSASSSEKSLAHYLEQTHQPLLIERENSPYDVLRKICLGRYDLAYMNKDIAQTFLNESTKKMEVALSDDIELVDYAIGFNKSFDPKNLTALNRALSKAITTP
jgi:hypothetical protein